MDERLIHLFSLIAEQVQNKQELFTKEDKIMDALLNRGCQLMEADAALMLMQGLVQRKTEQLFELRSASSSMRVMNADERSRFTVEAFAFITKLAHLGIITAEQRETLLEKAMAAQYDRIEADLVKTLAALLLFDSRGLDGANAPFPRPERDTAWN